jgi:hypothetical protein
MGFLNYFFLLNILSIFENSPKRTPIIIYWITYVKVLEICKSIANVPTINVLSIKVIIIKTYNPKKLFILNFAWILLLINRLLSKYINRPAGTTSSSPNNIVVSMLHHLL